MPNKKKKEHNPSTQYVNIESTKDKQQEDLSSNQKSLQNQEWYSHSIRKPN